MLSIVQLYKFTKNYSFAQFQWENFIVCNFYLNKSKKREK